SRNRNFESAMPPPIARISNIKTSSQITFTPPSVVEHEPVAGDGRAIAAWVPKPARAVPEARTGKRPGLVPAPSHSTSLTESEHPRHSRQRRHLCGRLATPPTKERSTVRRPL